MERSRTPEEVVRAASESDSNETQPSEGTLVFSLRDLPPSTETSSQAQESTPPLPTHLAHGYTTETVGRPTRFDTLRETWKHNREELTAKIHTKESDKKRSESLKNYYANNPETRKKKRDVLKSGRLQDTRARREERIGKDIGGTLQELHTNQGLTLDEIAQKTRYGKETILDLFKHYNIEYTPSTHPKTVKSFQSVQKILWSQPEAFQNLTDLQKEVIKKRFLTEGAIPSLAAIGEELGATRQSIMQVEQAALKRLRSKNSQNDRS